MSGNVKNYGITNYEKNDTYFVKSNKKIKKKKDQSVVCEKLSKVLKLPIPKYSKPALRKMPISALKKMAREYRVNLKSAQTKTHTIDKLFDFFIRYKKSTNTNKDVNFFKIVYEDDKINISI